MKQRVLVVDDDIALAEMLTIVLRSEGFDPIVCGDGDSALAAFRERKPDLVLLDLMLPGRNGIDVCRAIRAESGVPIVMQANQNIHHRFPPPFNWLEQRAFRRVAAAYGCSETVCEVSRAKGFSKPAPVIPFGANADAFRPRAADARRPDLPLTIGFVGRMLPGKGLNILAGALEKLKSQAWRLLVVGDGPERARFEQSLTAAGISNRVEFTGAVDFGLVPEYFRQMDMLVLPTETTKRVREQFGRVLVEAMASGVPVIGSTCGAIPEVIGDAGLVFAEGDHDALAAALSATLPDELDVTVPDGGMHLLARLRRQERDVDLVARLREQRIGPTALSRCAVTAPPLNGLMINYANIAKEDAGTAAERLRAAMG